MIKIERYRLHESADELGLEELALSRLDGYRWQAALHPNWPEDLTSWALGDEWIDK